LRDEWRNRHGQDRSSGGGRIRLRCRRTQRAEVQPARGLSSRRRSSPPRPTS